MLPINRIPDDGPGSLKPRAQAVLCALRTGPRTARALFLAIGETDKRTCAIDSLLTDMAKMDLIVRTAGSAWGLTYEGIGWLESNGLSVSSAAKTVASELWQAQQAGRP